MQTGKNGRQRDTGQRTWPTMYTCQCNAQLVQWLIYSLDSMQKQNFQRCDKFAADPVIIFVITGERFPRCPPKAASALNFNHGRKKLWSERRGGGLVITSANISSIFTKLISSEMQKESCRCIVTKEQNHPSYQITARGDSSHTHLSIITIHNVYFVQYIFRATEQAQTYRVSKKN